MKRLVFVILLASLMLSVNSQAQTCGVYFTGIGCPHCAKSDPYIFEDLLDKYPDLIIIEYEVYRSSNNGPLMFSYEEEYSSGFGIPLLIFGSSNVMIGDIPIMNNAEDFIDGNANNPCPLIDGVSGISELDFSVLPGTPNIWTKDRILISNGGLVSNELLRNLLTSGSIQDALQGGGYNAIDPQTIPLSGKEIHF